MRTRVVQRGFVALARPVRTFSITKSNTSYQFDTCQHFFYFVFTETEKVTQTGTGSEYSPVSVARQNETTLSSSKQGISFFLKLVI